MAKNLLVERVAIVVLICIVCLLSMHTCNHRGAQLADLRDAVELQHDTIIKYKDAVGREHATTAVQKADVSILKAIYTKEIDSLKEVIGFKDKELEAATFAGTKASGNIAPRIDTVFVSNTDTVTYGISYADKWLSLDGRIGSHSFLNYTYSDSLVFATFRKKKSIRIDAYSLNPNVKFTGLHSISVPVPRKKRFGIGPYFGLQYYDGKIQPAYGIGASYHLIEF